MTTFQKAKKTQRPLKMALFGPSGSGKTFSALKIATAMGGTIAVIDTERNSASLYAEDFEFDTAPLDVYSVNAYVELIVAAKKYDTVIIDSLSHAWDAKGGILEEVDRIKIQKGYRDSMRAWNDVKPTEMRLWNAMLDSPSNVIATMRSKTAYEIDRDDKGKLQVAKLGLAPIQRGDKEYEFDVVGQMNMENTLVIDKTRCTALREAGGVFKKPGENVAVILKKWLSDAEPAPEKPAAGDGNPPPLPDGQPAPDNPDVDPWADLPVGHQGACDAVKALMGKLGWSVTNLLDMETKNVRPKDMSREAIQDLLMSLEARVERVAEQQEQREGAK